MSVINLEVVRCSASKNGGFILKLQNKTAEKTEMTPFGAKTATKQTTYYMKVDSAQNKGFKADLDVSKFEVVERPWTIDDQESDDFGKEIICKWLHLPQTK